MLPIIMNTNFKRLAVVDDYISFIWTSRYYTAGDFELCVDVSETNVKLFVKDYYVMREDDENVGIIEDITIQRTEDGQEMLIAKGRFLSSILGRRIIAKQTVVSGKVSKCMEQLVDDNIISVTRPARIIPNFTINSKNIGDTMKAQFTGQNLLEALSKIGQTYGIGFKVTLNEDNEFVFTVYQGVDRTYDQNTRPWVIFSDTYDNLLSAEYEENYQDVVTAVLVAGEGEGLDRKTIWATDGTSGLLRREIYSDQRNIRSDDGEITEEEYMELLQESGKENLTKYTTAFTGIVYFENISYKKDIKLGDICVIENSRWGLSVNSRLVEVIESVNEAGDYSILPTFGI